MKRDISVLILARTTWVHGVRVNSFSDRLSRSIELAGDTNLVERLQIDANTVHAAKGEGADIVILLDVTKAQFPKVHPHAPLFYKFGETATTNLEDERRLFYVAVTRAKSHLLLLTSKNDRSPFVEELPDSDFSRFAEMLQTDELKWVFTDLCKADLTGAPDWLERFIADTA